METPKSCRQLRPKRNPTPRLSDRKRSLFDTDEEDVENEDSLGIAPLDDCGQERLKHFQLTPSKFTNKQHPVCPIEGLGAQRITTKLIQENEQQNFNTPTRRSTRLMQNPNSSTSSNSHGPYASPTIPNCSTLMYLMTKENVQANNTQDYNSEEQLQILFSNSMSLEVQTTPTRNEHILNNNENVNTPTMAYQEKTPTTSPSSKLKQSRVIIKRHNDEESETPVLPKRKCVEHISTKSFYSTKPTTTLKRPATPYITTDKTPSRIINKNFKSSSSTVPQSARLNTTKSRNITKLSKNILRKNFTTQPVEIDVLLKSIRNEKLRNFIVAKQQRNQLTEKVHNILKKNLNPIEQARPLITLRDVYDNENNNENQVIDMMASKSSQNNINSNSLEMDFSDIERSSTSSISSASSASSSSSEEEKDEEVEVDAGKNQRKFFKTKNRKKTNKQITITNNIKATINDGKLKLIEKKQRHQRKRQPNRTTVQFNDEQAAVNAILANLNDTINENDMEAAAATSSSTKNVFDAATTTNITNLSSHANDDEFNSNTIAQVEDNCLDIEFRKRLPYNTNDPTIIEQQHLLLDFLISYNICNEENFKIFIASPDNHKAEASKILDEVIMVVNESESEKSLQLLAEEVLDDAAVTAANLEQQNANSSMDVDKQQATMIANEKEQQIVTTRKLLPEEAQAEAQANIISLTNNTPSGISGAQSTSKVTQQNLFPIFNNGRWRPLTTLPSKLKTRLPANRFRYGGLGYDQYQIDAGQLKFGAQQCKQCGLIYSAHEPEDEALHSDYHTASYVLRFKGWLDEDVVSMHPEWGKSGRIIRISETSHVKRHERLLDILKIVDKELGFSSYIMPRAFVAFLAVRSNLIVGLCLVQPLKSANKYLCINGVDCCTEEEFPAKCGISRIWVAPLHRNLHIATSLIKAAQRFTLKGEEIPIDMIAFSAPTESGKIFAKKLTKTEQFLVYQ